MSGFFLGAGLMLVLLLGGVWVAVALGIGGVVGLMVQMGLGRMQLILGIISWEQSTNFVLIAVPLFIFMGEVLFHAGIMNRIYDAASKLVGFVPGGLLQTNIAACTVFAACSGSSVASAATIGSVAYPQLTQRGYNRPLALGSIAAGGTLGILVPPSIIFIIYGSLAEVSVGRLFMAGVIPGLLLATLYAAYIAGRVLIDPRLAPRERGVSWGERLRALGTLWQVGLLALVVLGGIYGGIASPTEVAALGATLAVGFAAMEGKLNWTTIERASRSTVRQTSMILFIVIGAKIISLLFIQYRISTSLVAWIAGSGTSATTVLIVLCLLYLVLGMFFEGVSMMVITVPFVVPLMVSLGVDLVWLGVLICIMIEVSLITPPVGVNLYVLQGATGEPLRHIIVGSAPFVVIQLLMVPLLFLLPSLALYLPSRLF